MATAFLKGFFSDTKTIESIKKIVLISSGQPSLNPRLIKEADTLADAGYSVTVLYAYWNDWGTNFDIQLLPSKKWEAIRIGGHPVQSPVVYLISRLIHKLAKLGLQKFGPKYFAELAIARSSYFLLREGKKHLADLYIGHNSGALPAIIKAAKANKKPCGFDAEDFHRFELSDDKNNDDVILTTYLEDKYIPQLNYLSVSSPQIAEAYQQLFPAKNPVTILNVFPKNLKVRPPVINISGAIMLFWFSQTIGNNRGIEDTIKALKLLGSANFELHLLGHINPYTGKKYINTLLSDYPNIHFHDPVSPDELVEFASQFDIGLASENNTPFNRNVCLSNKIFTYMQAGLAIVASDTIAQKHLLREHPTIGKTYEKTNIQSLANILAFYQQHREYLYDTRLASLTLAQESLNWENESRKFLNLVKETLD